MWKQAVITLLVLALAGCAGIPVSTDYDPERNFRGIDSFAWLPPEYQANPASGDPLVRSDLADRRIQRAVTSQLVAQGLAQVEDPAQADVLATYHIGTEEKIDINTWRSSYGYYPCWHCWGPHYGFHDDIWVDQYTQGTLIIDLIDAESRKLIWRGVADRRLPHLKTPEERQAYINETVTAILSKFPPAVQ